MLLAWCMENGTQLSEETRPIKRAANKLAQAEQAGMEGNQLRAYELSLQATEAAPRYAPAWAMPGGLGRLQRQRRGRNDGSFQPIRKDDHPPHLNRSLFKP